MSEVRSSPNLRFVVDGKALTDHIAGAATELTVCAELGLPTQAQVIFRDPPHELWTGMLMRPGQELVVSVDDAPEPLFRGDLTCVEHLAGPGASRQLFVRAYDRLHRLRKNQRLESHAEVTVEDLARRLVDGYGLSVHSAHQGPVWRSLLHDGRNDLALLRDVAYRAGLFPIVQDDLLQLLSLQGHGDPVALTMGENLQTARTELNADRLVTRVEALGWNPRTSDLARGEADAPALGRRTQLQPEDFAGPAHQLVRADVEGDGHAEQLCLAELTSRAAAGLTLWGLAEGNPRLWPGRAVELTGLAPHLDGRHVLTRVEHQISGDRGYMTELSTQPPPAPAGAPPGTRMAEAEVTQVADPEGRGRVRVRLLAYGGIETDWLRVMAAGAGANKGWVITPSITDRVLVLLADGDPARAVVLGGLFSDDGAHDAGVQSDRVERLTLRTPSGHQLVFDEAGQSIELVNADGTRLHLSAEQVTLHSKRDLVLEAPGNNMTLRAKRIDFEQA